MCDNRRNGVVGPRRLISLFDFEKECVEFARIVNAAGGRDGSLPCLPGFKIMPVIEEGVKGAIELMRSGKMQEAFTRLDGTRERLMAQMAGFAKKLAGDPKSQTVGAGTSAIRDRCRLRYPEEILAPARTAVMAFEAYIHENKWIDPKKASQLCWAAQDAIDKADKLFDERRSKAEQIKRDRQAAEEAAARAAEAQQRSTVADELLAMFDASRLVPSRLTAEESESREGSQAG